MAIITLPAARLTIPKQYDKTKMFLTVDLSVEDESVKLAGHAIVNLDGSAKIKDVVFEDHLLGHAFNLYTKSVAVIVDVSKFVIKSKKVKADVSPVTCKLKVEAGNNLLETYELDDSTQPENNTVYEFQIKFQKEG